MARRKGDKPTVNKGTNIGRYKMNDYTALKMGLKLNKGKRYRLTPKQTK